MENTHLGNWKRAEAYFGYVLNPKPVSQNPNDNGVNDEEAIHKVNFNDE